MGFFVVLLIVILSTVKSIPIHVMLLYSSQGNWANVSDTRWIGTQWQQHIQNKSSFPFNVIVEEYDILSNCTLLSTIMETRLKDPSLPPITAIVGEGDDCTPGTGSARIAANHQIPIIMSSYQPDINCPLTDPGGCYRMPMKQNTSVNMLGPVYRIFREVVNTYVSAGVKSVAMVSNMRYDGYNPNACNGAGKVMSQRGVNVLGQYLIQYADDRNRVIEIVQTLKKLNPDAVLWCDFSSCAAPSDFVTYFPMQTFKDANYLPKALLLLDCLDTAYIPNMDWSLLNYVTAGNFVHRKLLGNQFVEDFSPYSSLFRPPTPDNFNGYDQMNIGMIPTLPTSTKLFYDWYNSQRGYDPSYYTVFTWSAFDVLENALYWASTNPFYLKNGVLTPLELWYSLRGISTFTPVGLVKFDANGINTNSPSIITQLFPGNINSEIVGPSGVATASFVYPMPTWEDRIYTWTLTGSTEEKSAMAIAAACTFILLAIIITTIVHRQTGEIKMVHYLHVTTYCLCAICVCWSTALLWQADNIQKQCNGYLWGVYLPASVFLTLNCMKAYRLSTFLLYTARGLRPKPFLHSKVVKLTMYGVLFTILILLICSLADPPMPTKIIVDPYRPRLDYHICQTKNVTTGLLYMLVIIHVVMTIYTVAAVRNGMEAFQDGMIMKEAFLVFYFCVIIALVLSNLGLEYKLNYLLRCAFLSVGSTLFCLRLMLNRVVKYWLPESVLKRLNWLHKLFKDVFGTDTSYSSETDMSLMTGEEGDGMYTKATATADEISQMLDAIMDPYRGQTFKTVAEKALVVENVNFIVDVLTFSRDLVPECVIESTSHANALIQEHAAKLVKKYINAGSEEEVNVSATVRIATEKAVNNWEINAAFPLELKHAESCVLKDSYADQRALVFEPAMQEIVKMLFQNIWTKFKIAEAEAMAEDQDDGEKLTSYRHRKSQDYPMTGTSLSNRVNTNSTRQKNSVEYSSGRPSDTLSGRTMPAADGESGKAGKSLKARLSIQDIRMDTSSTKARTSPLKGRGSFGEFVGGGTGATPQNATVIVTTQSLPNSALPSRTNSYDNLIKIGGNGMSPIIETTKNQKL